MFTIDDYEPEEVKLDYDEIAICKKCGRECTLISIRDGTFWDDAWGIPKRFPTYAIVTACCRSEDYEIISLEDEYEEEE
ncbi:hypothetical protein J7M07_04380 [bacterium]|nr:hypothetical protein [bacterium]